MPAAVSATNATPTATPTRPSAFRHANVEAHEFHSDIRAAETNRRIENLTDAGSKTLWPHVPEKFYTFYKS